LLIPSAASNSSSVIVPLVGQASKQPHAMNSTHSVFNRAGILSVALCDMQGRVALQGRLQGAVLDVSILSAGVYSVLVTGTDGTKVVTKWIKQ
jgi:hypothetical protein